MAVGHHALFAALMNLRLPCATGRSNSGRPESTKREMPWPPPLCTDSIRDLDLQRTSRCMLWHSRRRSCMYIHIPAFELIGGRFVGSVGYVGGLGNPSIGSARGSQPFLSESLIWSDRQGESYYVGLLCYCILHSDAAWRLRVVGVA